MLSSEIREKYNEAAPTFNRWLWLSERLFLNKLRKKLVSQARGKVLEVAVGTGTNLPLYPPGCDVIGIDLSEGMIVEAKKLCANLGLNVTLLQMDAERLEFEDESFDTVLTTLSLCTIPDPVKALAEMKRVLRPGGRILLFEHVVSGNTFLHILQDIFTPLSRRKLGCNLNRDTVGNLAKAGLIVESTESRGAGIFRLIRCSAAHRGGEPAPNGGQEGS
ncbi:MAG: methyltransferase domain-containing protein [Candidatus Dadabacteria bacterium]|nr:methyltransferase domain-containing protein [Candidatus Dadabacteria bacterium]